MKLELKNKVALVTGGSKGIGAEVSFSLAQEGVKVAFCARTSDAMKKLKEKIELNSGICMPLETNVFNPDEILACVQKTASTFGGIDILINNVGGAIQQAGFDDLSDEQWLKTYELNVLSVVRFTRACLPFLKNSSLKRIINISSISALQPGLFNPHYTTTKAAIVNLSKHLANILAKEKILVNVICPGPIHSDSWDTNVERKSQSLGLESTEMRRQIEEQESAKIPLGFVGEGHHVASLVCFLASPLSGWTTGSCFHLNGGKLANIF